MPNRTEIKVDVRTGEITTRRYAETAEERAIRIAHNSHLAAEAAKAAGLREALAARQNGQDTVAKLRLEVERLKAALAAQLDA